MRKHGVARWAWVTALSMAIAACGGGSGDGSSSTPIQPSIEIITGNHLPSNVDWQPPAGAVPSAGNYVYLESEPGDPVGGGRTASYTEADSSLSFEYWNGQYEFRTGHPSAQWLGVFSFPVDIRKGFYGNATLLGFGQPGIWWSTVGVHCEALEGWFVIDDFVRDNGLASVELRFEQKCSGAQGALRGKIRWNRADLRSGPIESPPANLWQPPAAALPAQGSYLYLEGDEEEWVSQGGTRLLKAADGTLDVVRYEGPSSFHTVIAKNGRESWSGNFIGINELALRRGYYPGIQKYPYHSQMIGAMEWTKNLRGCGYVNGWFVVDDIAYVENFIVALELRFEQRCDASSKVLRGKLKWSLLDVLPPDGPTTIPVALWQPPEGATPASGDFLYVESEPQDSVGQGNGGLYASGTATLRGTPFGNALHFQVDGVRAWSIDFKSMSSIPVLETGHFDALPGVDAGDRQRGGLSVSASGRSCPASSGWVAVDKVERDEDGAVSLLELRFQQRCAGDAGTLRGKLRWTPASGAVIAPMPAHVWQPPPEVFPAGNENYLYIESDYGDPLARGDTRLYTSATNILRAAGRIDPYTGRSTFGISLDDDRDRWTGSLLGREDEPVLRSGLYGNLVNPVFLPAQGKVEWSGRALNCFPRSTGWLAIDSITYVGAEISSIEARFEHHCTGYSGALRGKFRWSSADTTRPAGPAPIPEALWQPPASALPAVGNYVYFESEYGDFVGQGRVATFKDDNAVISANYYGSSAGEIKFASVTVRERNEIGTRWSGTLSPMDFLPSLEAGFYADVSRAVVGDPARGAISWSGESRGCNMLSGWLAVDAISVSAGGDLLALDARFEQHCEFSAAALRGKIHWVAPGQE